MGYILERLNYSLENAAIIIEGAMWLHTFLVDFCERNVAPIELKIDNNIFIQDLLSQSIFPIQTGSDLGRPCGRPNEDDRNSRCCGEHTREDLKIYYLTVT